MQKHTSIRQTKNLSRRQNGLKFHQARNLKIILKSLSVSVVVLKTLLDRQLTTLLLECDCSYSLLYYVIWHCIGFKSLIL